VSTNTSSEGPSVPTTDPATPDTVRRSSGYTLLVSGVLSICIGLVGLLFFFMVPALVLVLAGIPLVVVGCRGFAKGKPRLARGPGRAA
jgi:hypothetical protein